MSGSPLITLVTIPKHRIYKVGVQIILCGAIVYTSELCKGICCGILISIKDTGREASGKLV